MTRDEIWFAAHPRRAHRIRLAFPGEFDGAVDLDAAAKALGCVPVVYAAVRQLHPGLRCRLPSTWCSGSRLSNDEPFAHAMFDLVWNAPAGAVIELTREKIASLARAYETAGVVS